MELVREVNVNSVYTVFKKSRAPVFYMACVQLTSTFPETIYIETCHFLNP